VLATKASPEVFVSILYPSEVNVDRVNEELEAVLKGFLIFGTVNVMVVLAAILEPVGLVKVMVFGEEEETTVELTVVAEFVPTVTETP